MGKCKQGKVQRGLKVYLVDGKKSNFSALYSVSLWLLLEKAKENLVWADF